MKIKIVRSKFFEGLKKVQNIVNTKGEVIITQNVLLEARDNTLFLTTTDLEISIRSSAECEVLQEGATTLPAKLLVNAISKAPEGVVEIDVDSNDRAVITAGSAIFKLNGMNMRDFPALPEAHDSFSYVIPQMVLREMLRKTHYAASQDDTRKTLRGVLMSFKDGKLTMAATDGRRLAMIEHEVEFPADEAREIILPPKVVAELQHTLESDGDARITFERSQIAFDLGGTQIYSKVYDEIYPNFRAVIPESSKEQVVIDRMMLLNAVERINVLSVNEVRPVALTFEAGQLVITANAGKYGEARDSMPIKYDGERVTMHFDPRHITSPLRAIDEDEIKIEFTDETRQTMIKCSLPFLYLMMPVRINSASLDR